MVSHSLSLDALDRFYPARVIFTGAVLLYFAVTHRYKRVVDLSGSYFAVAVGVVVFVIWTALEPSPSSNADLEQTAALSSMPRSVAGGWIVFRAIGSILVVPVVEELAFRGYLLRRLISRDFDEVAIGQFSWLSFVISSALFGLLHSRWLAGTIAGLLFATALYRRNRLSDAILAHSVANAMITVNVLFTARWSAWS
jgi:CAAX prenyl protease-like protein